MNTSKKYIDQTILLLRNQLKKEIIKEQPLGQGEIEVGGHMVTLERKPIFIREEQPEGLFSIKLPVTMEDMHPVRAWFRYPSSSRPQVIKTDSDYGAYFTFSRTERKDGQGNKNDIRDKMLEARSIVQKANRSHVCYEDGDIDIGQATVIWFDYRGYAVDGNYYNLLFLFYVDKWLVMGNFQCAFSIYSTWKTTVVKLLSTIKFHDEEESENA